MPQHPIPFPFTLESIAFMQSFMEEVNKRFSTEQKKYISAENINSFSHGIDWQSHNSSSPDEVSSLKKFQHEISVEADDVIALQINILSEKVNELAQSMATTFVRELFETVSTSCDSVGNTVVMTGKSPAQAFLEMLERIEFGVNREGKPSLPSMHLGADAYKAFLDDPFAKTQEFKKQVDEITKRKTEAAMAREAERLSRFKTCNE